MASRQSHSKQSEQKRLEATSSNPKDVACLSPPPTTHLDFHTFPPQTRAMRTFQKHHKRTSLSMAEPYWENKNRFSLSLTHARTRTRTRAGKNTSTSKTKVPFYSGRVSSSLHQTGACSWSEAAAQSQTSAPPHPPCRRRPPPPSPPLQPR